MGARSTPLPRKVVLHPDYVVRVRLVAASELPADRDGEWDADERVIAIRRRLSQRRRWYIYLHELTHAMTDAAHELLQDGVATP